MSQQNQNVIDSVDKRASDIDSSLAAMKDQIEELSQGHSRIIQIIDAGMGRIESCVASMDSAIRNLLEEKGR